jgi:NTP pyrophosphatase (non-canonical NTP hydrolase)
MELNSELDRLRKYSEIDAELKRAKEKHPNYPTDDFKRLAIIQEELGETFQAALQYHDEDGHYDKVRKELIQTAAMCMRMLENMEIDHSEY